MIARVSYRFSLTRRWRRPCKMASIPGAYEYECTEQTVSRFLPNVLTFRALKELGISDSALEARLPGLVKQGLTSSTINSAKTAAGAGGRQPGEQHAPYRLRGVRAHQGAAIRL